MILSKSKLKFVISCVISITFFCSLPFAIRYVQEYQNFKVTARNQPPIIIEVAVINCGKYVGSLKTNSARYCSNNRSVRVLILPLTKEQLGDQDFPIILSKEDEIIHAFVSASLSEYKQERCLELLEEFKSAFTDIDFKVS